MRTTLTLDDDVVAGIERLLTEQREEREQARVARGAPAGKAPVARGVSPRPRKRP